MPWGGNTSFCRACTPGDHEQLLVPTWQGEEGGGDTVVLRALWPHNKFDKIPRDRGVAGGSPTLSKLTKDGWGKLRLVAYGRSTWRIRVYCTWGSKEQCGGLGSVTEGYRGRACCSASCTGRGSICPRGSLDGPLNGCIGTQYFHIWVNDSYMNTVIGLRKMC